MHLAFLTPYVSRQAGGLFNSVRRLAQTLAEKGRARVDVLGVEDQFTREDLAAWQPLSPRAFPVVGPGVIGFAPALSRALDELQPDLVHSQGLWMFPSIASRRWARRTGRPHMVTPRGMLDAWALNNSGWKKRVAGSLFENGHLRNAACLHALCESELESIRNYGLRNPVCIIPNGVDLPDANAGHPPPWAGQIEAGRQVLLYLGRIHPKKGLPDLLHAWQRTQQEGIDAAKNWNLVIAGWDQSGHLNELEQLAHELRIDGQIHFPGPQFGGMREACYSGSDAFILPSLSEGLPMVVLEAWAHGKPVLMTPECNFPEGFAAEAAVKITASVDGIAQGLHALFSMTAADRNGMGARGRKLAVSKFTWPKAAEEMRAVYDWLLHRAEKPACVTAG